MTHCDPDMIITRYTTPLVTQEMTCGVQKICDACKESWETGEKVVLSWGDKEIPGDYVKI